MVKENRHDHQAQTLIFHNGSKSSSVAVISVVEYSGTQNDAFTTSQDGESQIAWMHR